MLFLFLFSIYREKRKRLKWKRHENMAILESCCGCSLAVSCAVLGVYLLVAYAIAFGTELWWILDTPATPTIPAYLLCLGYFILLTFSVLLLHGLSMKKTTFLLVWLFMMGILLGPEAGLVLYLSIHYWRITSLYGLIEVTCWSCRLLVNAVGLLCVQSLYTIWREEKRVLLRLEALKTGSLPKAQGRYLSVTSMLRGHEKKKASQEPLEKADVDPYDHSCISHPGSDSKIEGYDCSYVDERYAQDCGFSEFNASIFDPTVIDTHLENLPYLTIRKKLTHKAGETETSHLNKNIIPKTRSLIDFRDAEFYDFIETKQQEFHSPKSSKKDLQNIAEQEANINSNSLDRKIYNNKNFKIFKKLSPFCNRKGEKINVYQINPPKDLMTSKLDSQLNELYSNRGMYAFDEKLKKVIYYPPEFFGKAKTHRSRMNSYGSSQSRSSVDTDSEDIRHISDVAL